MTKRVLVGVDGSQTAARAAMTAAELAKGLGAQLILLSAYGENKVERVQAGSDEFVFSSEGQALEVAQRVKSDLLRAGVELPMEVLPESGQPAEALVRVAERMGIDVIVVGNKRVQGLTRVLGSIATDVARKAPCDVYIAHTHER